MDGENVVLLIPLPIIGFCPSPRLSLGHAQSLSKSFLSCCGSGSACRSIYMGRYPSHHVKEMLVIWSPNNDSHCMTKILVPPIRLNFQNSTIHLDGRVAVCNPTTWHQFLPNSRQGFLQ